MASIILKKRKLCEAIDQDLQIVPASYEMKRRLGDQGEYIQLYESILPQLRNLFPEMQDGQLMETLKHHNNDILSAIEYLKYNKIQSPGKPLNRQSQEFDGDVVRVLRELSQCQSESHGYEILKLFKNDILAKKENEKQKVKAENLVLRKAFKIQKKILIEENTKRMNTEDTLAKVMKDLESSKSANLFLMMRLSQLEKSSTQNYFNNHIC